MNFHRNDKLRVVSTTYVQLKWIVLCARKFEFEATFFSKYEKNSESHMKFKQEYFWLKQLR